MQIFAQAPAEGLEAAVEDITDALPEPGRPCPDGGEICGWIVERVPNDTLAGLLGFVLPRLFTVVGYLVSIAIVAWLLRRVVKITVMRVATSSSEAVRAVFRRTSDGGDSLSEKERDARIQRRKLRTQTLAEVVASIAVAATWVTGLLLLLAEIGINIAPLLAGAGILGIALGFGAQSMIKDFLAGTFMLIEDQFGVGDVIDLGEAQGVVEAITLRATRIRDIEGTVWHVPNGEVKRVANMSQLWARSLLDISVSYDTDVDQAAETIMRVANQMADDDVWNDCILEEPELWGVEGFGVNEVVIRLGMKVRPAEQWKVNREFRRRIKMAFDEQGISIPYPRQMLLNEHTAPYHLNQTLPRSKAETPSTKVEEPDAPV